MKGGSEKHGIPFLRARIGLFCLLLAGITFAGCGAEEHKQVEITVIHGWGSTEEDHVAMRNIYGGFEEKNPDIKLRLVSMPTSGEMLRKVEDMLTVGEIPDVVFLGGIGRDSVYRFMVENGLALDLMPYLQEDTAFKESLAPANLDYWTTDGGELYTVSDVLLLSGGYWYNKDIFQRAGICRAPETWEEFAEVCAKIGSWAEREKNGIAPLQIRAEGYLYLVDSMMADGGGSCGAALQNNEIQIEERRMGEILRDIRTIYDYSALKAEDYGYRDETDLFNEEKLAIYINGVWGASMIQEELNVEYALLPAGEGRTMSCESTCLGYILGNNKEEDRKEASIRFLKYMMSEEIQERILRETGQMPANPMVNLQEHKEAMPRFYQAAEKVLSAEKRIEVPDNLWDSRRKKIFEENILDVLGGEMNGQTFIYLLK